MKLSVLGAGSPRFPLLLNSLLRRKTDIRELALYDTDIEKLGLFRKSLLESILRKYGSGLNVRVHESLESVVEGADYVFSSIRTGGQEARLKDEQIPLEFDTIGQETVGAGGFSLALRTIPVATRQAKLIHKLAPEAWIINFTNPAGIITQAVTSLTDHDKIVGICDAPVVIGRMAAGVYGVSSSHIRMAYFGLNHLGWVHSVELDGKKVLRELINRNLDRFISGEPFYAGLRNHIIDTGLLPNEYLFYYLNRELVVENQKKFPGQRARSIKELDVELYRNLEKMDENPLEYYNEYIEKRNGSYMANETGFSRAESEGFSLIDQNEEWGYDAVALSALEALRGGKTDELILNIPNGTFCPFLEKEDIIETSCILKDGDFMPAGNMPELPGEVRELILQVKNYERTTVRAAGEKSRKLAVEALGMNPLVPEAEADKLFNALKKAHEPYLDYLK